MSDREGLKRDDSHWQQNIDLFLKAQSSFLKTITSQYIPIHWVQIFDQNIKCFMLILCFWVNWWGFIRAVWFASSARFKSETSTQLWHSEAFSNVDRPQKPSANGNRNPSDSPLVRPPGLCRAITQSRKCDRPVMIFFRPPTPPAAVIPRMDPMDPGRFFT